MSFPLSDPIFIVIEGLDGAGTTTQSRRVAEVLRQKGQPVSLSQEPSDGPIGVLIRQMLSMRVTIPDADGEHQPVGRETLALLFAADRLDHLDADVNPALARGDIAISDRYYHSSLAYQGDVDGEDSVDYGWVQEINGRARIPDLTVFLEAPVDLCLARLADRGRRDIYESRQKLERLQQRYEEVMALLDERGERILRLDAAQSKKALTDRIIVEVETLAGS